MMSATQTIAMLIAPEQFRDEELFVPKKAFEDAGYTVHVYSTRHGEAVGMLGGTFNVTEVFDEATPKPADADALIVVGGFGAVDHLVSNPAVHTLARTFAAAGKPTAAICISGMALAKAGVLNGRRATVWACDASLECYKEHGVNYEETPVVKDMNLITAEGPEAAQAFAETILAHLSRELHVVAYPSA